jgi:hypothetical protein
MTTTWSNFSIALGATGGKGNRDWNDKPEGLEHKLKELKDPWDKRKFDTLRA